MNAPSSPPTERDLTRLLLKTLSETLPPSWTPHWKEGAAAKDKLRDATLSIRAEDGHTAELAVEFKKNFDARDIPSIVDRSKGDREQKPLTLAITRYLPMRTRDALTGAGISYFDATGNMRLVVDDPALFISQRGLDRDPWRSAERPMSSLRGLPAARVVRALVDFPPPRGVREVSELAGASLGSTARTIDLLDREALIGRDESGAIRSVDWPALLERWSNDYDPSRGRRVVGLLAPRGVESVRNGLRGWRGRYAISGSLAAAQWEPYAATKLAIVYAADAEKVQSRLKLVDPPSTPNVLVIEPGDDLPFERTITQDDLRFASHSQVVVDLLSGTGRNPEEGNALIGWMKDHEDAWRSK